VLTRGLPALAAWGNFGVSRPESGSRDRRSRGEIEEEMTDTQWKRMYKALQVDILNRRGLKHEWRNIDEDVLEEIELTWREIIEKALTKP